MYNSKSKEQVIRDYNYSPMFFLCTNTFVQERKAFCAISNAALDWIVGDLRIIIAGAVDTLPTKNVASENVLWCLLPCQPLILGCLLTWRQCSVSHVILSVLEAVQEG